MAVFDFALSAEWVSARRRFVLNASCRSVARRLGIMGVSGSGKSLLLQLLAGLQRPQSGYVRIGGRRYGDMANGYWLPPQQRRIGFLFQHYALFPHLTVAQNIAFGRRHGLRQPPRRPDGETVFWLEKMQLMPWYDHYPHQISGGQKQRTALARACINRPDCLLLDEPFSALDAGLRREMRQVVAEVQAELAVPVLLVSHDAEDTAVLADEVWLMQNGGLLPPDGFQAA